MLLVKLIEYVEDYHSVTIEIDADAIESHLGDRAPEAATPVTFQATSVPLRDALESILAPLDLICLPGKDGQMRITARPAAAKYLQDLATLKAAYPSARIKIIPALE